MSSEVQALANERTIPIHLGTMETLGVLLGRGDSATHAWLETQIDSHDEFFRMLLRPDLPVQAAMILLRMSVIPRLGYLTRVLPPRLTATHAGVFDSLALGNEIRKLGLPAEETKQTLSLPIRLGGFGLRSVASTCNVAFWSSIALVAIDLMDVIPENKRQPLLIDSKNQVHFARQLVD